ncbi:YolD-like family protein [Cytobacillus kochii]|uniref:YolD-like family protein n=1 Tax=Cytobacillus kochii TaxID=859143 RepID=UPI0025A225BD|nr:YolD-like family protein [Cytobacillus kochii]MDM5205349.1 YolD-like family protein [Cytobacillus kochii]
MRDRGMIKWQPAFFMPQQKESIENFYHEETKIKKPLLDEQQFEEMGIIIMESLKYTLPIYINRWESGQIYKEHGIVDKLDYLMQYIIFENNKQKIKIKIPNIISVERD